MRRFVFSGLSLIFLMTGCGTIATPSYQATTMIRAAQGSATAIVRAAQLTEVASPTASLTPTLTSTVTPTVTKTASPIPTNTQNPTATTVPSSSSSDASLRVNSADADNGEVLFKTFQPDASFACSTCHHINSEERLIGPGLLNISIRAESRIEGLDTTEYIYQSITNPDVYIVEEFPGGLMPQNWADIYSDQEIYDIIAYLFTLQE